MILNFIGIDFHFYFSFFSLNFSVFLFSPVFSLFFIFIFVFIFILIFIFIFFFAPFLDIFFMLSTFFSQDLLKQKASSGGGVLRNIIYGCSELLSGDDFLSQLERLGSIKTSK